mmetsp:Transcript_40241/g.72904  ORF Transcript_40241/g.72904 Transcript_40241/m.72904 type:complete len:221 (+) Transcript_40241:588-1250(+)
MEASRDSTPVSSLAGGSVSRNSSSAFCSFSASLRFPASFSFTSSSACFSLRKTSKVDCSLLMSNSSGCNTPSLLLSWTCSNRKAVASSSRSSRNSFMPSWSSDASTAPDPSASKLRNIVDFCVCSNSSTSARSCAASNCSCRAASSKSESTSAFSFATIDDCDDDEACLRSADRRRAGRATEAAARRLQADSLAASPTLAELSADSACLGRSSGAERRAR